MSVLMRILKRSVTECQCHWHEGEGNSRCCWCGTEAEGKQENGTSECWRSSDDSFTAWLAPDQPNVFTSTPSRRRRRAGAVA